MGGTIFSCAPPCTAMHGGGLRPSGHHCQQQAATKDNKNLCSFQMPLHYPRYKKSDYATMPEWQLDCLLKQYGLPVIGDIDQKKKYAMGAFLWPDQYE